MTLTEQVERYAKLTLRLEPELGRCTMSVREVAALTLGSVIKLSQPLGSKIDVNVGGAPFGAGEILSLGGGELAIRFGSFPNAGSSTHALANGSKAGV